MVICWALEFSVGEGAQPGPPLPARADPTSELQELLRVFLEQAALRPVLGRGRRAGSLGWCSIHADAQPLVRWTTSWVRAATTATARRNHGKRRSLRRRSRGMARPKPWGRQGAAGWRGGSGERGRGASHVVSVHHPVGSSWHQGP